jgi:hypothetical protein
MLIIIVATAYAMPRCVYYKAAIYLHLIKTKMSKLTAIEILEIKLLGIVSFDSEVLRNKYKEQFKIAKEMEKEQIMDSFNKGLSFAINPIPKPEDAKNYYKKSIKKTNDR